MNSSIMIQRYCEKQAVVYGEDNVKKNITVCMLFFKI